MFDLVFVFTGLCGFALDPVQSQDGSAEGLDVVLVQAADHVAELVVPCDSIHHQTTLTPTSTYGQYQGFSLDNRIVRLRNRSSSDEDHVTWTPLVTDSSCPDASNARSYGWVVPMSDVTPGEGLVLHEFRSPSRTPPPEFRAVIQLESGQLRTLGFARSGGHVMTWNFGRGLWRREMERALGDRVELRQRAWNTRVVLEFVDVSTRHVERLVLKRAPAGGIRLIEVFNTPKKDICCYPTHVKDIEKNHHFPHLYDLLPDNAVRSVPEEDDPCTGVPDDVVIVSRCDIFCVTPVTAPGNPQCPGADMSGP